MHFLAISGSLRAGSSNTTLLEAAARLATPELKITLYSGMNDLPHFNPDLELVEDDALPSTVRSLRDAVGNADGLILSTPEYAHGLPGSFKNLLDWLVGSTTFPGKPVAVLSPSARAVYARAQLHEILTTMSARVITSESFVIQLPSREMSVDSVIASPEHATAIRGALGEIMSSSLL